MGIHIGTYDSLFTTDPTDWQNYPCYIAHLDTNFRITWITEFPHNTDYGSRWPVVVKQLRDSSYVVVGDQETYYGYYERGWACKVSKTGQIIWSRDYHNDTTHYAYLRDVVERSNCSLVFVGASMNDTLSVWHTNQDLWLVNVDSNGCEIAGCLTTAVPPAPVMPGDMAVYPNPTSGNFTIKASAAGKFELYTILGQRLQEYAVTTGETDLQLPANAPPGLYIGVYRSNDGGNIKEVKFVYQP